MTDTNPPAPDCKRLADLFERLPQLLNACPDLVRRGAFLDARFQIGIGAISFDIAVTTGRVTHFERGPFLMRSWRFAIRGNPEAWSRWWQPVPEPGWHDLFALTKRGCMVLEGDLQPLMANLQFMKDFLVLPRPLVHETSQ